jgi:DNA-binding PadR family transcriptional regulator
VVESLERRGLIEAQETKRSGRLPERTVYRLTSSGLIELHDWLTDLLSTPVKEYPAFEAALSFLPAVPPDDVVALLTERAHHLEAGLAQDAATRELAQKAGLPRLFWVEAEYDMVLREAELGYVRRLTADIQSGALDGLEWWRGIHDGSDDPVVPPPMHGPSDEENR